MIFSFFFLKNTQDSWKQERSTLACGGVCAASKTNRTPSHREAGGGEKWTPYVKWAA